MDFKHAFWSIRIHSTYLAWEFFCTNDRKANASVMPVASGTTSALLARVMPVAGSISNQKKYGVV